ncbi:MAG: hypothetical protein QOC92_277 [Acidimicrobiaceae bacterium]|jgi:hypothetical protein
MLISDLLQPDPPNAGFVGVEREYRVLDEALEQLDFRVMVHKLGMPGSGLDPGDPNAHHLPSGLLLTADGPEAEVATPPVPLAPGCTRLVSMSAEHGEDALVEFLPAGAGIEGFSTHLNVSVGDDVVAIAALFARHFALGMMLLLDRPDSPGLLVRPRPGRLEVGGDFAAGEQLRVALTFATGATRCCADAVRDRSTAALPPEPRGRIAAARDRPGWFIGRGTFARDLYDTGREATVRCGPTTTRAGDRLAEEWAAARRVLPELLDEEELSAVDEVVDGRRAIPIESVSPPDSTATPTALDSPFANLAARERAGLQVQVEAMSWAAVAFRVQSRSHAATHVVIPRRWLRSFLRQLDDGALDAALHTAELVDAGIGGPRLVAAGFDPRCVVPPEPMLRISWWRDRRPELIGLAVGCAVVVAGFRGWPW